MNFTEIESDKDLADAIRLAHSVFVRDNGDASLEWKERLWREDPGFKRENVIVAKDEADAVIGAIRLVPRTLYRQSEAMSVAGITSVCLADAYRGRGFSVPLTEYALDRALARGFDISLLFARRAVDHYYTKFGYWGVSSYSRLIVKTESINPDAGADVQFEAGARKYIPLYSKAYVQNYRDCFGRFARDEDYWGRVLERFAEDQATFQTIFVGRTPAGYVIRSETAVHEIALADVSMTESAVSAIANAFFPESETLTIEVPPEHAMLSAQQNWDVTLSRRECRYGGHMVKILDTARLGALLRERDADASVPEGGDASSFATTIVLLGAETVFDHGLSGTGALPFNVSLADQF